MTTEPALAHGSAFGQPGLVPLAAGLARIDWKAALISALLWGLAVTALESLVAAAQAPSDAEAFRLLAALLLLWTSRGLVLALTAQWADARWRPRSVATLFAAEAVLLSLAWDGTTHVSMLGESQFGLGLPLRAAFYFNLWVLVVYGGPFFWFCLHGQRMRRTRDVLARAEIERSRSAALLHEAAFAALKGRIDPALLLRAMTALRTAYEGERERADALLDALVGFLRHAMPGVRSGRTTLLTELSLLRAYAHLMQQLDGGRSLCHIDAAAPARDLAFPSMLLLPLVERLRDVQAPDAPALHVELTSTPTGMKLVLDAATPDADWLGPALARRLQQSMQILYGHEGRWKAGGSPSLTLWLPLPPATDLEELTDERCR
jgi:hypothetical protein